MASRPPTDPWRHLTGLVHGRVEHSQCSRRFPSVETQRDRAHGWRTGTRTPIPDLDKRWVEIGDQALEMGA